MRIFTSRRSFLATTAAALAARRLGAQSAARSTPQSADKDAPTFSSDVKVVNILATVRTKGGEIVADLTKDDFLLSEDRLSSFQKTLHVTQFPYFEVLLKTSQVKGTPLTATVEAYRTYPIQP